MKKILIVSGTFFPNVGGIEEQIKILGEEYIRKGFSVDILTRKQKKERKENEMMFNLNVKRFSSSIKQLSFLLKYGNKYEIIISRWYYRHSAILGLLKFLKILKTTTVICTDTGGENDEINTIKKALIKFNLYKIYFYFIGQNNYLNCLTIDNKKHLEEIYNYNKIYSDKITRIYNGINIYDFKKDKKQEIKNILFIGRFEKEKGIIEAIKAFQLINNSNIILNLAGYGSEEIENEIINLIKDDKRIIFHGKVYGDEKNKLLDYTDLLILPSYSEGQPVVITEMAIRNIPVITTDVGNNKEIYGDNIIYVEKRNIDDLKEKMERIIENIENYKYDYTDVLKKIDIDNIANQFINLK